MRGLLPPRRRASRSPAGTCWRRLLVLRGDHRRQRRDGGGGDRHVPGPGRQEQLRRQPELQRAPGERAGAGRGRLAHELDAPDGILAVTARRRRRALRRDLAVTAIAGRPRPHGHDRLIALTETADGYRAREAAAGLWEVEVEARRAALVFREVRRVSVRRRRRTDGRPRTAILAGGGCCPTPPLLLPAATASTRASCAISTTLRPRRFPRARDALRRLPRGSRTPHRLPGVATRAPTSPATASASPSTSPPASRTTCWRRSRSSATRRGRSTRPPSTPRPRRHRQRTPARAGGRRLRRRQRHAALRLGVVGSGRRHPRPVPLAVGADRAAGDRLCRPAVLPLGDPGGHWPAASTWTCRSPSA
jgi:hypothetical protein